ncbi:hypothetical protein O181_010840 [Austropuccinia psidii MF-1]|uniref:Uncharacterized protein n=1 Tax=Austropuccinia psidii MF-1 TaxID=1389203 RepID=A0A9Q3BU11_9BASI|nr:hypothetical protein [Austropuccinia psidii MF-1]
MICLVLALNLDLKMSSKLTSICDSNHSDSLPSLLYGAGVFDRFRELSEESMAPKEIYDINKTYDGFKYFRVIKPPCINCWKKGVPCVEYATSRSTRGQFCNLWKGNCSQANHSFPDNPRRLWRRIKKGGRFVLEALVDEPPTSDSTSGHSNLTGSRMRGVQKWSRTNKVPILVTRKEGRLGKLKRNFVVQDENDTDAEGSDELYGEELEITTPIQKRRIQSTSLSPVQASAPIHEVIRSLQQPQPPIRSPNRPSTLASISTNIQPPVASTSRDPMTPEPESIFDNRWLWNITGKFTYQKKVNKKVVTSLFSEVDTLTELFVDKAMKSAIPGEPTRALAREAVAYENALVSTFREALKKF